MERNTLSNGLKDHSIGSSGTKSIRDCNNNDNNKPKDSWNFDSQSYGDDHCLDGFSWPPRSYTCSFCKREFRSAQALGGHMNVHRRDRAKLRQYSPPRDNNGKYPFLNLNLNPNPNPNPSPNFSSSFLGSDPPLITCTLPSLVNSPPSESKKWGKDGSQINPLSPNKGLDLTKMKGAKSFFEFKEFDGFIEEDGYKFLKKSTEIVRLDLEIGLLSDHSKEDLDLELRLGTYS